MKKFLLFLCAITLVFGTVRSASAITYIFSDIIDYWNHDGTMCGEDWALSHPFDSVSFNENDPLNYTHIISDDVDLGAGDQVTSATIELDFTNDIYDGAIYVPAGLWGLSGTWDDQTEHIYYAFDGGSWYYLDEVDNQEYSIGLDLSLLNIDGQLTISLQVDNNDTGNTDAWLDHSLLSGTAETAPVPEPSTILLLGSGLLGLVALGRKRFSRKK